MARTRRSGDCRQVEARGWKYRSNFRGHCGRPDTGRHFEPSRTATRAACSMTLPSMLREYCLCSGLRSHGDAPGRPDLPQLGGCRENVESANLIKRAITVSLLFSRSTCRSPITFVGEIKGLLPPNRSYLPGIPGKYQDWEVTQLSPLSDVLAVFGRIFVGYSWVVLVPAARSSMQGFTDCAQAQFCHSHNPFILRARSSLGMITTPVYRSARVI